MKRRDFIKKAGGFGISAPLGLTFLFTRTANAGLTARAGGAGAKDAIDDAFADPAWGGAAQFVRKEINAVDTQTIQNYADAVAAMRKQSPGSKSQPNGLNWTNQAKVHLNNCPHGQWKFFPWHREYLFRFEQIVRTMCRNENFILPYWDWTANPALPEPFRDASSPLSVYGPGFSSQPDGSRTSDISAQIAAVTNAGIVTPITQITDFQTFMGSPNSSGQIEGSPHNGVHNVIGTAGGANAPMGAFMSPLDPIFWLHHCNVDRHWADWQARNASFNKGDIQSDPSISAWNALPLEGFYNTSGASISTGHSAADALDTGLYDYTYDSTQSVQPSESSMRLVSGRSLAGLSRKKYLPRAYSKRIKAKFKALGAGEAQVTLESFGSEVKRIFSEYLRDPSRFDNYVFRLKVANVPKIPHFTTMLVDFEIKDGFSTVQIPLIDYHFFFMQDDEAQGMGMKGMYMPASASLDSNGFDVSGDYPSLNDDKYVKHFNYDFKAVLRAMQAHRKSEYPAKTEFAVNFIRTGSNAGGSKGTPVSVEGLDFGNIEFLMQIAERV